MLNYGSSIDSALAVGIPTLVCDLDHHPEPDLFLVHAEAEVIDPDQPHTLLVPCIKHPVDVEVFAVLLGKLNLLGGNLKNVLVVGQGRLDLNKSLHDP